MTEEKKTECVLCEYLTIEDLAKRWKKHKFTIYRWKDEKKNFPKQHRIFGNILFKIQDVIAYEKEIGIK